MIDAETWNVHRRGTLSLSFSSWPKLCSLQNMKTAGWTLSNQIVVEDLKAFCASLDVAYFTHDSQALPKGKRAKPSERTPMFSPGYHSAMLVSINSIPL